uniref:Putative secreted protein n=1 Tax=Anopheles marajoara TaxID=58244 RepID=A0A2M4C944_9DIPT
MLLCVALSLSLSVEGAEAISAQSPGPGCTLPLPFAAPIGNRCTLWPIVLLQQMLLGFTSCVRRRKWDGAVAANQLQQKLGCSQRAPGGSPPPPKRVVE